VTKPFCHLNGKSVRPIPSSFWWINPFSIGVVNNKEYDWSCTPCLALFFYLFYQKLELATGTPVWTMAIYSKNCHPAKMMRLIGGMTDLFYFFLPSLI
jgi:hypothetical protein